ncbi:MAG: multidrug efflux SMR transporter [Alphaproteobacteria bacterium]|nr:multidrug efflux SMR transporter [Alphaproteobacteria bacterium]
MPWLILAATILFEVAGSTMMKLANGFTVFWPSVAVFICYGLSLAGLTITLKYIDLSVAYAIWSGVGVALVALIGIVYFGEPVTAQRILSLMLIVTGVVGLQLASGANG